MPGDQTEVGLALLLFSSPPESSMLIGKISLHALGILGS